MGKADMKKVSIVVPVYKSEMYLKKLVDSILNQTHSNIELILVDDESPDNCGKICDDYTQKDNRVVTIHKKNGGCCEARNKGLQAATGDYLMFADGDDWMELDCIEYLVLSMEKNSCQMAMTDSVFTTRDRAQNGTDNIRVWTPEEAVCGMLYAQIPIGPWNKMYTTSVIRDNNLSFSVPWFGEGLYFSTMAAQHSNKIAVGHRRIYNYRLNNPNSGTTVREVQHGINALRNIEHIKERLIVRTPATIHSADWHICWNCFHLMSYIIWSGSMGEHSDLYRKTKRKFLHLASKVLLYKEVRFKRKLYISLACMAPKTLARIELTREKRRFTKDLME
jgi:glycosyltransferase involved in cell wall biosynthesis